MDTQDIKTLEIFWSEIAPLQLTRGLASQEKGWAPRPHSLFFCSFGLCLSKSTHKGTCWTLLSTNVDGRHQDHRPHQDPVVSTVWCTASCTTLGSCWGWSRVASCGCITQDASHLKTAKPFTPVHFPFFLLPPPFLTTRPRQWWQSQD
jgi:hypothetical protein